MTPLLKRRSSSSVEASPRSSPTEINGSGKIRQGGDEIFGRLVAVRRAGLGLSQEDLAARMETSQSIVARIEKGGPTSAETLKRLAAALDVKPGTGALWSSLGRRWLWGGLAITVLVSMLVVAGLRSSGTDSGASSERLPQAVSAAPAAPVVGVQAKKKGQKTGARALAQQDRGKGADEGVPDDSRTNSGVPRQPAPARTPRQKPAPAPSVSPVPPQPSSQGSPSAPTHTTGKPVGSPGNGPGGGNGSDGGIGPGGTGPPGQTR